MAAGRWISLFLMIAVVTGQDLVCPEEQLAECKEAPQMKTLFLEDACKYFDALRSCIAQYSWECAEGSALYQRMVQEMITNKETFCKETKPVCDDKNLEACFVNYIDLTGSNLQDPTTFSVLCRNFTELSSCYSKASAPCYGDPMFANSHWEGIFGQVKINCLSTPECNYFEMSKCTNMLYEALTSIATIPSSTFLNAACSAYIKFQPCMTPLLSKCLVSRTATYTDFLLQMQNTASFVKILCEKHFLGLIPHTSCYDKTEVQTKAEQTCTNPLMSLTFAGEPDQVSLCRSFKTYVDCLKGFIETQCPGEAAAALAIAAYHESWLSNSLQSMLGVQCPPLGYNSDTQETTTSIPQWPTGNHLLIPSTTEAPPPPPPTSNPEPQTFNPGFETPAPSPPATTMKNVEEKLGASSGEVCRLSRILSGIFLAFMTFMVL